MEEYSGDDALKKLDPHEIESVTVLKDATAITQYGEKGKDGVIVITTKKGSNCKS
ncbi:hypothetical protein [Paraflavitalea speifideaquila]|uniref:hypothetical protein n=1 Tax=Paraflavitalea speifideaquila TaxID=3076558 RepID=UPI0028E2451A|nr:hypothetical protein [Paraflavitalea speifideiaquila]